MTSFRVENLHLYPMKSGAGIAVETARLEPEGLANDRRMMVVDGSGNCLTARTTPKLMQVRTHLDHDEIILTAPGMAIRIFARGSLRQTGLVTIWGDSVVALDAGDETAQWLTDFLGKPCRLVVKCGQRPLGIGCGGIVSFADTAPLLMTNSASLADLNTYLEAEVEMERFRPNLVFSGRQAYEEDGWAAIRIGTIEFEVAGACDRCIMTTLDPRSGEGRPDLEPLAMLGRLRRGEDGNAYFGQFLIPRSVGRLNVGDRIDVLARKKPIAILPGSAAAITRLPSKDASVCRRAAQSRGRLLRCVGIVDETHDFRTFRFEVEPGEAIDYKPGQFITLLLDIDGRPIRRNYTISSSPSRPHHISITVKRVEDGHISNWLHDRLKIGDTIRSIGPNGRFHLAAAGSAERLLMLSAGSGITPMMAMLRFTADANLPLDVHFHHSARQQKDASFLEELLLIRRQMAGRLRLSWNLTRHGEGELATWPFAGRVGASGAAETIFMGRLNGDMLRAACPDLSERLVLCCGPDGFRGKAREIFEEWQPSPRHPFLEETFGPDRSTEPLPEIGAYRISFLKSGKTVSGEGAATVLELARQAGVTIPAGCEAGICGTCRCKVVSGTWRIASSAADPNCAALSEAEKQNGYILACSTNPIGDVVVDL